GNGAARRRRRTRALHRPQDGRARHRRLCGSAQPQAPSTGTQHLALAPGAPGTEHHVSAPSTRHLAPGTVLMLAVSHVTKSYPTPQGPLTILQDVSFSLDRGQAAAIMGPSGSGKSTLLYLLGALEPPTNGTITLNGQNPYSLDDRAAAAFRNTHIGFVF